ncbi:hypothetical protein OEG84_18465 [Hoeflea sp. G2-23]|uniref:ABC-three component systems C-terminal domain-containing protein n=1 Tax=Hoeflea algicola TaxID=2983763 RepID=A0ABT3ZCX0_9HYPH|nr:ABC-three component system protein [Hoeflea algicola]MCY0149636.1 hypothetical protein [Hoeflea algicola]
MKEWVFTHNLIEIPSDVTKKIVDMKEKFKDIEIGVFGLQKYRELLTELSPDDMDELFGIRSLSTDNVNRLPECIMGIIGKISEYYNNNNIPDNSSIRPVPLDKMEFNNIPIKWRNTFRMWNMFTLEVEKILADYPDENVLEFVPVFLNKSYKDMKLQGLSPQNILDNLSEKLAGYILEHDSRYEASCIVLSSMFESCVIFEDKDKSSNPDS